MKLSISDGTANYQIPLTTADFKSADTLRKALHSHAPDVAARATDQAIAQLLKLFSGVDVSRLDEPFAMPLAALASKDGNIVKAFSLRLPEARSALQPERATSKHAPSMPRGVDVEMQEFHKPRLDVALLPKLKSEGEKLTKNQAAQQPAVDKLASELATHMSTLVADRRALFRAVSELPAYDPLRRDFGLSKLVALDGTITTLGNKQA
ncbi:MAG: hypothetical protein IT381_08345 [Deltaproteobacteria bacterium]|nr:hypothetical protein [Deltaproteobacteria bacterium]